MKKNIIIPKKVVEMASFIKECDANGSIPVVIQNRRSGRTMAHKLARDTKDADFEIVEPKQIAQQPIIK